MDQVALVNEFVESGKRLIDELVNQGFVVQNAFWAKPTDSDRWYLYLVSPFVDENGAKLAYRLVNTTLRNLPGLLDDLEIKVVRTDDSLAKAAIAKTKPKVPVGPFAIKNPKPYQGPTCITGETTLGGIPMDGAYFYPPLQPNAPV